MGSTYSIKWVPSEQSPEPEVLQQDIEGMFARFDQEVSNWRSDSDLARFNEAAAGSCMAMPKSVIDMVKLTEQLYTDSEGSFDITVAPLLELWGFHGGEEHQAPHPEQLQQAMLRVGQQHLHIRDDGQLCKDVALSLDLSSLAAGYMIDRVVERLASYGVTNYMVEITGELKAAGRKPGNRPWRIAIEEPRDDERVAQMILALDGEGVSTSGDYRNYYEVDGQRFSHTFDARSGHPVMHKLAAVTVLDETAAEADALSTLLMIMGEERGWDYAIAHDIPAFFVIREGEAFVSRGTPPFNALAQSEE
ncbi:MAG: FAD:protein FMN transferase [Halopseudomonas sp.]